MIESVPYLHAISDVVFFADTFRVCAALVQRGIRLFIATNQSGIGRGYYSLDQYHRVATYITDQLAANGAPITETLFCPYHPEHGIGDYKQDSPFRKPNPGMLLQLMTTHQLTPDQVLMVGDSDVDIQAAKRAGVASVLVGDSHTDTEPDYRIANLTQIFHTVM